MLRTERTRVTILYRHPDVEEIDAPSDGPSGRIRLATLDCIVRKRHLETHETDEI